MANIMKIKPEHFQALVQGVEQSKLLFPTFSYMKEVVCREKPQADPARLYRWELLYAAPNSRELLLAVYEYANDSHIDTALKRAIPL